MSYAVNGAWLGEAFTIPKDQPVFPHALAKNAAVTASFDAVPKVDTGLDTTSFLSWQVYMWGTALVWTGCVAMGHLWAGSYLTWTPGLGVFPVRCGLLC